MAVIQNVSKGTKLALGIVLLWAGGLCLFIAFEAGKAASLATPPKDVPGLVTGLASTAQQASAAPA